MSNTLDEFGVRHPHPPEAHWLPGLMQGDVLPNFDVGRSVQFTQAEIYPTGFVIRLTARFREAATLEQQRELAKQVRANFVDGPAHEGPHLVADVDVGDGPAQAEGRPWGHHGSGGVWRLTFWLPIPTREVSTLVVALTWPAQAIDRLPLLTSWRKELQPVLDQARRLWERPEDGYTAVP